MSAACAQPRLALGPVLYYWPRDELLAFYDQIKTSAVDIVYLGETVCSKRRTLSSEEWLDLARELTAAGKQVVLSTLALLEAESELKTLRRICANGEFAVEANDMAAVHLLAGQSFISGPAINVYNARALRKLAQLGLRRFVLPLELSRDTLAALQTECPAGVETEVFVYGRLPLAYAARCFTARAHNLPKDDCQLRCLDYPNGLLLNTQEAQPFLVINGIQTQSAATCNLLPYLEELRTLQVDVLRISPQAQHTLRIVEIFHAALHGDAVADISPYLLTAACAGYWHGQAGMAQSF